MIMKFTPEAGHETGIRKVLMKNEQISYKKAGLFQEKKSRSRDSNLQERLFMDEE